MNSIREVRPRDYADDMMRSLIAEAAANIRGRHGEPAPLLEPSPSDVSPVPEGKHCIQCLRTFHASATYLKCRACDSLVCRKGNCKGVHHAHHRVAFLKQQQAQETK